MAFIRNRLVEQLTIDGDESIGKIVILLAVSMALSTYNQIRSTANERKKKSILLKMAAARLVWLCEQTEHTVCACCLLLYCVCL